MSKLTKKRLGPDSTLSFLKDNFKKAEKMEIEKRCLEIVLPEFNTNPCFPGIGIIYKNVLLNLIDNKVKAIAKDGTLITIFHDLFHLNDYVPKNSDFYKACKEQMPEFDDGHDWRNDE